MKACANKK